MHNYIKRPGALIAGGHYASLGAARNLGRHGIPVFSLDSEPCITSYSKYIQRFFNCPAETDDARLVSFINKLSVRKEIRGSVLFASTDEQVRIFSQNRDQLSENYIVSVPPWEITRHLYDKRLTHALASERKIPIPETITLKSPGDLHLVDMEYPLVVKPAITTHLVSKTKKKAYRANSFSELSAVYQNMAGIMDPGEIIIQSLIPGGASNLYSYFGYFKEGFPLTGYAARRLRQHPMEFGKASTYAVSTDLPELECLSTRLLSNLGYTGLAEVEFMYNPLHSRFEFLEVNPRLWGWHTLSIEAGVDLPYFAYADMVGEPYVSGKFTEGVKWIHLATDLPTALLEIIRGNLSIGDYLGSVKGSRDAVFCTDDPLPFLMELCLIPYLAVRRGF